jgi:glutamate formiminotransferase
VDGPVLECVINVSEGRSGATVAALSRACGPTLLDVHSDPDHNRSVFTLAGRSEAVEEGARALATAVVEVLDIGSHEGVHPRIGTLDVVPFVSLVPGPDGTLVEGPIDAALAARDRFAGWAASTLALPCFLYGPERTLPDIRRTAWSSLRPQTGPSVAHPTAGAVAVGARPVLVAYNLWLHGATIDQARAVASAVRGPGLRTLGLAVAGAVQVSCNLVDPWHIGPGQAYDIVSVSLPADVSIRRAEQVGLIPAAILHTCPKERWTQLGLGPSSTIEARLEKAGLDGGSL